jgi:cell division protein FtsN
MAHRDDEFDEYVEERPEPVRGSQRLLIIILSVGCLALAVSNVVLAMRVTQLRRALVAERPAVAPAPAADRSADAPTQPAERAAVASSSSVEGPAAAPAPAAEPPAPRPSAERRVMTQAPAADRANTAERPAEPPTPAASIASSALTPAASEPAPPTPRAAVAAPAPEPPKLDLPPRSRPREQARVAAVTRTTDRPAAVPSSPERSTAAWMVQAYGRADAESRARTVAEFYGAHSSDGAYWRRVLAEINATRR